MTACAASADSFAEGGLRRGAPLPPLPSLKKDNCIVNGRYRAVFVAQENVRLYIWKCGEANVGALTITAADCLEASEFQDKWHSYLNALKKEFSTGMWTRERQPRSGNWHAHAVVNVGWDIKTKFPRNQVQMGFYANVDPKLRELWKRLRQISESHGFGRIELLPLKYSGAVCARYFTKYLTKSFASAKMIGEEKCRLFGIWGGVRFLRSKFTFLSSRIMQKKKRWLAQLLELPDETYLAKAFGPRWWFHLGDSLSQVIMPEDFYKVGPSNDRQFDPIGWKAWQSDSSGRDRESADLMLRSQFNLLYDMGIRCFGQTPAQATQLARELVEKANPRQLLLPPFARA
jgi:hypothetical protein